MDPREELRTHLRPAVMGGAAIIASLAIYLALVGILRAVLKPFEGFAPAAGTQTLRLASFGAAALVILLILVLRPRLFRRNDGEDTAAALRHLQRASLVILVLGEIPAVIGLALFLIGGNGTDFLTFLFVSLALTFINFPRRAAWEEWLKG